MTLVDPRVPCKIGRSRALTIPPAALTFARGYHQPRSRSNIAGIKVLIARQCRRGLSWCTYAPVQYNAHALHAVHRTFHENKRHRDSADRTRSGKHGKCHEPWDGILANDGETYYQARDDWWLNRRDFRFQEQWMRMKLIELFKGFLKFIEHKSYCWGCDLRCWDENYSYGWFFF